MMIGLICCYNFNIKMINEIIDYRNGKYQGSINSSHQRNGLGIFIDDDLTFYITHWKQNKLQGPTLVYISHGKYTYGQWKNNQPHGLNVFRFGETVLLGMFSEGVPINKCLIIFQKFNIACILEQHHTSWDIIQSGPITSYKSLVNFIKMLDVDVPEYYFSLTKFACRFSNYSPAIKTYPCMTNCCYFGYHNGLALIFNSNNGLLSIGHHNHEELCQFGGIYEGNRSSEEGNFQEKGERITYYSSRPQHKIYSIFKKLHKKSLNFHNEYFDPKIKFFSTIQSFLRDKLEQITHELINIKQFQNISLTNINNSLDYQQYNEEQSIKINSIRDQLYSPKNTPEACIHLEYKKNVKKELKINVSQEKYFKRNGDKTMRQVREEYPEAIDSKTRNGSKIMPLSNQSANANNVYVNKSPFRQRKKSVIDVQKNNNGEKGQNFLSNFQVKEVFTPSKLKEKNNTKYLPAKMESKEEIKNNLKSNKIYKENYSSKAQEQDKIIDTNVFLRNEGEKLPTFKGLSEQIQAKKANTYKRQPYTQAKSIYAKNDGHKISPIDRPHEIADHEQRLHSIQNIKKQPSLNKSTYENIQDRKKRILKEYKGLNAPSDNIKTYQPSSNAQDKFSKVNIPYSIHDNNGKKNLTGQKTDDFERRYGLSNPRKDNSYLREKYLKQKKQNEFNYNQFANFQLKQRQANKIYNKQQNPSYPKAEYNNPSSNPNSYSHHHQHHHQHHHHQQQQKTPLSPLRPKRNYTYAMQ